MTTRPKLRRLLDLPGIADLELRALMKPAVADPDRRDEFPEVEAGAIAAFGIGIEQAEATALPTDWDDAHRLPLAEQVETFADAGWDVTDDRRKPLRMLAQFSLPFWLAIRGVAGELPFQAEDDTPEPWGASLAADAARFRKR